MAWWRNISDLLGRDGCCAMVTIVASKGSAPREPGARMLVDANGGHSGSIGGGALEWQAISDARRLLNNNVSQATLVRIALGSNIGQCCGGSVQLLTEVFVAAQKAQVATLAAAEKRGQLWTNGMIAADGVQRNLCDGPADTDRQVPIQIQGKQLLENFIEPRRQVLLFGAGHIGRALVLAMAPLPFDVIWLDSRDDIFPSRTPMNVTPTLLTDPRIVLARASHGAFVVVMTHSHAMDLDIVAIALADSRFAYVGLIGSATKRRRFCKRMLATGMAESAVNGLVCPIGVDGIKSKSPAVIAASVATELLIFDEDYATEPSVSLNYS